MSGRIDELYEAAQKATPNEPTQTAVECESCGEWTSFSVLCTQLADPQTVMALIEVYRAVRPLNIRRGESQWPLLPADLRDAIEKVEALG